jgi:hypothetical protein
MAQLDDRSTDVAAAAYAEDTTGWTGWIAFAGVMMVIAGSLQAIYGFIALVNDEWVVWGNRANVYLDLTTWGWIHLLGGVLVAVAGVGVFSGNILARAVGVVLAVLSLLVNFLFIPAYPIWAITVIVVDLLVIWALTAHGAEMRRT